jgi:hypothetical protein
MSETFDLVLNDHRTEKEKRAFATVDQRGPPRVLASKEMVKANG